MRPLLRTSVSNQMKKEQNTRESFPHEIPLYKTNEIDAYESVSNTISKSTSVITLIDNMRRSGVQLSYPYFVEEDFYDQNLSTRCQNPTFNKPFTNSNNDSNYIEYWSPEANSKCSPVKPSNLHCFPMMLESNISSLSLNALKSTTLECDVGHARTIHFDQEQMPKKCGTRRTLQSNPTVIGGSSIKVISTSNSENAHNTKSMPAKISFKKRVNLSPQKSTIMNKNCVYESNIDVHEPYYQPFLDVTNNYAPNLRTKRFSSKATDSGEVIPHICKFRDVRSHLTNRTQKHFEAAAFQSSLRPLRSSPCNIYHQTEPVTKSASLTIAKFTLHENDKGVFVPFSWLQKIDAEEVKLKIIRKELSRIPKPMIAGNKFYKSRHSTLVCKIAKPRRALTQFNLQTLE